MDDVGPPLPQDGPEPAGGERPGAGGPAGVEPEGDDGDAGRLQPGLQGVAGVEPDDGLADVGVAIGQGHDLVDQAVLGPARGGQRVDDVDYVHTFAAHASMASSAASWVATLVSPWTRPGTTATVTRSPARPRMRPSSWSRARTKSSW